MEKVRLEYAFYDKIKLDGRHGKHIVTFYREIRAGVLDNGSSLQVTDRVVHFLLHVQPEFTLGRDRLFISTTPDTARYVVVDYAHILLHGLELKDMSNYGMASDKPVVFLAAPCHTVEEKQSVALMEDVITDAGYLVYSPSKDQPLTERAERIERCSLVVATTDGHSVRTCFELGYAHAMNRHLITFGLHASEGIGDVLLAHAKTLDELLDVLRLYYPIATPLSSPTFRYAEVLATIQAKYKLRDYVAT